MRAKLGCKIMGYQKYKISLVESAFYDTVWPG
jgi:hypothetical protein